MNSKSLATEKDVQTEQSRKTKAELYFLVMEGVHYIPYFISFVLFSENSQCMAHSSCLQLGAEQETNANQMLQTEINRIQE